MIVAAARSRLAQLAFSRMTRCGNTSGQRVIREAEGRSLERPPDTTSRDATQEARPVRSDLNAARIWSRTARALPMQQSDRPPRLH